MTVETMANPLDKIKKIRSFDEMLTRGGQALSVYREQRRRGESVPTDKQFARLMDASQFRSSPVIAESLWQKFYKNGEDRFFPSFRHPSDSAAAYKKIFGAENVRAFVDAADKIVDGRIDLLGLKNLYVGTDIDWHREPLSSMRSPMKHWKQFDDLDTSETGNKKIIWELNRHQHFFTLGLAFWMTRDERFGETFARHLESWMTENPPGMGVNWSSSLEVSFRAMSWIWAFHFFKDSKHFTPELFKQTLKYLYRHGRHIEQYLSTYYSPNTHLTGEALGLYYLGTQLPFFERAKHWRKLGEDILFAEITKQILPDGVYFEQSSWYQRYTADFYAHFVVLKSLARDLFPHPSAPELEKRLEKAFDFMMSVTMPDGKTPIIGDDDGGRMLPLTTAGPDDFRGTLSLGAFIFDRGDQKQISGPPGAEIFWLAGSGGVTTYNSMKPIERKTASREFPDGGYCVMSDGTTGGDNYLLVDCGEVGSLSGAHGHADALSIELAVNGKTLFVDSGTYTYHESKLMRDYFRSSTAHNTLSIGSGSSSEMGGAFSWKTRARARRKRWITDKRFDFFEGSHNGYERLKDGATHTRSILFLKNDYWIIRDLVETVGEHEYALNFHYRADAKPFIGGEGAWVGDADHRMFTFGDNGSWHQKESWLSTNHGNKVNAPFLRFLSRGRGTQEFFTFILPAGPGVEPPEVEEIRTDAGRAFRIRFRASSDVFVFNDAAGVSIGNGVFDTNFEYTWARMSEGGTEADEFVLIEGNTLKIGATDVFGQLPIKFASATRVGSNLSIRTDLGRTRKSLSQNHLR